MNIIITGATGMVGTEVLKQALADDTFRSVTAIVRRPLNMQHPKLRTIIHKDYLDYNGLAQVFRDNDACIWCVGISQNQVGAEEYMVITHDYTIAAAKAMLTAHPDISLLFLSAEGANETEKSRFFFGRVKGKTENALRRLPFKQLYIARPAGIIPSTDTGTFTFVLKMQYALMRLFRYITPKYVITSSKLAQVLLQIVKTGADDPVFSCKALYGIAQKQTDNKQVWKSLTPSRRDRRAPGY